MNAEDKDKATAVKVLNTPMGDNDAEASTVRGYLVKLLALVWQGRRSGAAGDSRARRGDGR